MTGHLMIQQEPKQKKKVSISRLQTKKILFFLLMQSNESFEWLFTYGKHFKIKYQILQYIEIAKGMCK